MKFKKMTAVLLACTLLAGQTVYAQEGERKGETEEIGLEEKGAEEESIEESTEQPDEHLETAEQSAVQNETAGATEEENWELANVGDMNVKRGQIFTVPKVTGLLEEVEISEIENDGVIEVWRDDYWDYNGTIIQCSAIKNGTAVLEVRYGDYVKQISVTVSGPQPEYPVGDPVEGDVNLVWTGEGAEEKLGVLKDNGEFWNLYPEVNKLETNVKKITGKYMLKNSGDLIENGSNDQTVLGDIKDFVTFSGGGWLALQTDGTLWCNKLSDLTGEEVESGFQKIDSSVKTIEDYGYLKNDGTLKLWSYHEYNTFGDAEEKAEYINDFGYYTESGTFHFLHPSLMVGVTCDWKVKDFVTSHYNSEMDKRYDVILTMDGEVWAEIKKDYGWENAALLGKNAKRLVYGVDFKGTSVDWEDKEGNYYTYDKGIKATEESPMETTEYYGYHIEWNGEENGGYLFKNGAKMLDYVKKILYTSTSESNQFAIVSRTDGSVWLVKDDPILLLEGAVGNYKRGDVNEDGEVNIKDLQLILRGVCEKIELTERQIMIADVVEDGKVDIQDLRKELRFVCGKITEL